MSLQLLTLTTLPPGKTINTHHKTHGSVGLMVGVNCLSRWLAGRGLHSPSGQHYAVLLVKPWFHVKIKLFIRQNNFISAGSAKICRVLGGMELRNFRRGRHLYSAGRSSRWASARILVISIFHLISYLLIHLLCGFSATVKLP